MSAGSQTYNVTLQTAGARTVTGSDIPNPSILPATSSAIPVTAASFVQLQLLVPGETAAPGSGTGKIGAPSTETAGTSYSVTVNAVDAFWNVVTNAGDTVGITSTDTNASLPAISALVSGVKSLSLTNKTVGSWTITATDSTDASKTNYTSPSITVIAGAFAKLQLLVPGETAIPGKTTGKTGTPTAQTAGTAFAVTVNAVDANWNLISTNDLVAITSSDVNAALPTAAALVGGSKSFNVTLKTAGSRTVTASDSTHTGITANTSPAIAVNAGLFAKLQLLVPGETASAGSTAGKTGAPTTQTAATPFNVTVNAVDANWNLVTNVTDSVGITTTDSNAQLPANAALTAGTKNFSVTLITAGSQTLTATDTDDPSPQTPTTPPRRPTPAPRSPSTPARL